MNNKNIKRISDKWCKCEEHFLLVSYLSDVKSAKNIAAVLERTVNAVNARLHKLNVRVKKQGSRRYIVNPELDLSLEGDLLDRYVRDILNFDVNDQCFGCSPKYKKLKLKLSKSQLVERFPEISALDERGSKSSNQISLCRLRETKPATSSEIVECLLETKCIKPKSWKIFKREDELKAGKQIKSGYKSSQGKKGSFYSAKLGRQVCHDSEREEVVLKALEYSNKISFYREQPLLINNLPACANKRYYRPDIVALTNNGHAILVEVKPLEYMFESVNLIKFSEAVKYAVGQGWGACTLDADGMSILDVLLCEKEVPASFVTELSMALFDMSDTASGDRYISCDALNDIKSRHDVDDFSFLKHVFYKGLKLSFPGGKPDWKRMRLSTATKEEKEAYRYLKSMLGV